MGQNTNNSATGLKTIRNLNQQYFKKKTFELILLMNAYQQIKNVFVLFLLLFLKNIITIVQLL